MSEFSLHFDGTFETDKVFFLDRSLHRKGEIYPITDLKTTMRFNENSEVSFTLHKYNNGNLSPLWNDIDDIKLIEVEHKGIFEIDVPKTSDKSIWKAVHGISLAEAELSQKLCTLEVNTDNDIARDDYSSPTVLYNPDSPSTSLLHRILTYAPHYSVGHVDAVLQKVQRTFSWTDKPVYDALQDIAKELECIFIFDKFKRVINCYELNNYGINSGVFIDNTENLAETITITGDTKSVKNCFKIEGGDDEITNRIGNRLISDNRIWVLSDTQKSYMSETLQRALSEHDNLVKSYQNEYNNLWDTYNELIVKKLYYESGMMPSPQTDDEKYTAQKVFTNIWNKITYACATSEYQGASTIALSLKSYAKILMPSGYSIKFSNFSNESLSSDEPTISFTCQVYLDGEYDEDGKTLRDICEGNITLPVKNAYNIIDDDGNFTNDYYQYLKQQVDAALEKSGATTETVVFNPPIDDNAALSNDDIQHYASYDEQADSEPLSYKHYTKFSKNRLISFKTAYEACSAVVASLNSNISSDDDRQLHYVLSTETTGSIYNDLLGKYNYYITCLSARISYLDGVITDIKNQAESTMAKINAIKEKCKMENFLKAYNNGIYGDELWHELCSFAREDTYSNSNYSADGLAESTIIENIEGLIDAAEKEIQKACEINYTVTTTIENLYTIPEFKNFWDKVTLGNYINIRIDEDIFKLRLIELSIDYTDIKNVGVVFSEFTKLKDCINDTQSILSQAHSMASSFSSVAKQAESGSVTAREYREMKAKGLDAATTMITNADDEEFIINQYGLTGRMYNPYTDAYDSEQLRIIHNLLAFTDDGWQSTRLALGKIYYQDLETKQWNYAYGLNAEVLISNIIMSESLKIYNESGTYSITNKGFLIEKDGNKINIDAQNSKLELWHGENDSIILDAAEGSFKIKKKINEKDTEFLSYTPDDGLKIIGTISGSKIISSELKGDIVNSGEIHGGKIIGAQIEGAQIFTTEGAYKLQMSDGILSIGSVKIFNGLLNYHSNKDRYNNAFNISCDGKDYTAEFGYRWKDDGTVRMISNRCLSLGEYDYPIKDIYMSGNLNMLSGNLNISGSLNISGNINGFTKIYSDYANYSTFCNTRYGENNGFEIRSYENSDCYIIPLKHQTNLGSNGNTWNTLYINKICVAATSPAYAEISSVQRETFSSLNPDISHNIPIPDIIYPCLNFSVPIQAPNIQSGYIVIQTEPNKPTTGTITFPHEFKEKPNIVLTPVTGAPGTQVLGVGVQDISTTGCTVYITRTNSVKTWINWIAMTTEGTKPYPTAT